MDQGSQLKWDIRFLRLAREISTWSKDPSTKVGAVLVGPGRDVISVGYNGFARGCCDHPDKYADRATKLASVIHGEENALLFSDRWRLLGATCYTFPWQPCGPCASKLIQAGIKRVVSLTADDAVIKRWGASLEVGEANFKDSNVELKLYDPGIINYGQA